MRFTHAQVEVFRELSHDRNPLHVDVNYARRTQFGRPVFYGVAAVLALLGEWACGRKFRLLTLEAEFKMPLFVDEDYDYSCVEKEGVVTFRLAKGETLLTKVVFTWKEFTEAEKPVLSGREMRREALNWDISMPLLKLDSESENYRISESALSRFGTLFRLEVGQMPRAQIETLAWSSFHVGMVYPGRQALFTGLELKFGKAHSRKIELAFDPAYNVASTSGSLPGVDVVQLNAFRRPDAVRYPIEEVRAAVGVLKAFEGRTVLVTGASRGFGAVLAKAFALHGADVVVNYNSAREECESVAREIASIGRRATCVQADVTNATDCQRLVRKIGAKHGKIDILVNNASPTIISREFIDQSAEEFLSFVDRSVRAYASLTREALPIMPEGATLINVSSVYAREPRPGFSHYIAAKLAIEGLTRVLAEERPRSRFIVARPPRMLTDQTNATIQYEGAVSAAKVAGALLTGLQKLSATGFHELDLGV